jgi:hypothetical protein
MNNIIEDQELKEIPSFLENKPIPETFQPRKIKLQNGNSVFAQNNVRMMNIPNERFESFLMRVGLPQNIPTNIVNLEFESKLEKKNVELEETEPKQKKNVEMEPKKNKKNVEMEETKMEPIKDAEMEPKKNKKNVVEP